jgi:hypothetical protein
MARCSKCGGNIYLRFGSGQRGPICTCPRSYEVKEPKSRAKPKPSSRLSVAEQLAVLVKLHEKGALTDQEFRILKAKLIAGGD